MNSVKFVVIAIIAFASAMDLKETQSQVNTLAELQGEAKEKTDCCPGGERIVIKER